MNDVANTYGTENIGRLENIGLKNYFGRINVETDIIPH